MLGILPALLFDPLRAQGGNECPRNLVLVADRASAAEEIMRAGVYLGLGWASPSRRSPRSGSFERHRPEGRCSLRAPSTSSWWRRRSRSRSTAGSSPTEPSSSGSGSARRWPSPPWLAAVAWLGSAPGVPARRSRGSWSTSPGRRRRAASGTRWPTWSATRARARFSARELDSTGGRSGTVRRARPGLAGDGLVRDGITVAVLGHAPGRLGDEQLVDEVAAAARWRSRTSACRPRCERASRSSGTRGRIVAAADAERKRLERDLHDGAQQRLVGLALSVRLAQAASSRPRARQRSSGWERRKASCGSPSRSCASSRTGSFPPCSPDEGLAAAVEALAEEGRIPIRIGAAARGAVRPRGRDGRVHRRRRGGPQPRRRGSRSGPPARTAALVVEVDSPAGGPLDSSSSRIASARSTAPARPAWERPDRDPSGAPVRLVIADDETLLREGLARLLVRQRLRDRREGGHRPTSSCGAWS